MCTIPTIRPAGNRAARNAISITARSVLAATAVWWCVTPATADEPRVWTSRKGSTVEANCTKVKGPEVTLVTKDRKEIKLPVNDLSLADRQYLVENSLANYFQSTPKHVCAFARLVRRVESNNTIPEPEELARIYGFDSVEKMQAAWIDYIKSPLGCNRRSVAAEGGPLERT